MRGGGGGGGGEGSTGAEMEGVQARVRDGVLATYCVRCTDNWASLFSPRLSGLERISTLTDMPFCFQIFRFQHERRPLLGKLDKGLGIRVQGFDLVPEEGRPLSVTLDKTRDRVILFKHAARDVHRALATICGKG